MPPGGGKCASGPSTSALGGSVGESSRLQRRCQAYPGSAETVTGRTRSSRDTRETPSAVPVTTRRTVLSPTAAMLFVASPTSRLLGSDLINGVPLARLRLLPEHGLSPRTPRWLGSSVVERISSAAAR